MRIVLIVPSQRSLLGSGARALSAWLRRAGHDVRLLFLPADARMDRDRDGHLLAWYELPRRVVGQVLELCEDADLVGISLLSCFFELSCTLTAALKEARPTRPVVWGGIHPTVRPEECLEHADFVCVGEGEAALEQLCAVLEGGGEVYAIPNIWCRRDGEVVRTPVRPRGPSMDDLPPPDMDLDVHFTRDHRSGRIEPLDEARFRAGLHWVRASRNKALRSLIFLGSRGCPHRCAYCGNSRYHVLYGPGWGSNRLGMDRLVDRVAELVDRFPYVQEIEFADDDFAARPLVEIDRFCERFPQDVDRAFHFLTTPELVRPERIEPLREAGCFYFQMGIQSAHPATLERYQRRDASEQIRRAAALLADVSRGAMTPCYHVILDDPFEDEEAQLATLRFVNSLPRPFWLKRSGLVPYPGTPVHDLLVQAGKLDPTEDRGRIYPRVLTSVRSSPIALAWRLLNDGASPATIERMAASAWLQPGQGLPQRLAHRLAPGLDAGLVRAQRVRRWWNLGAGAVTRGDLGYLRERGRQVWADRRRTVPTSLPPG